MDIEEVAILEIKPENKELIKITTRSGLTFQMHTFVLKNICVHLANNPQSMSLKFTGSPCTTCSQTPTSPEDNKL